MRGDRDQPASDTADDLKQPISLSGSSRPLPTLMVMYHPDLARVGDRVIVGELASGRPFHLSRQQPAFSPLHNTTPRPLDDPFISRTPITLVQSAGGLTIKRGEARTALAVNGQPVQAERFIGDDRLQRGVVLTLGRRVVLWLQWRPQPAGQPKARYGLIGESAALLKAICDLETAAASDDPALLCGPAGTGKALFARAIHDASPRHHNPYLAVNTASLSPEIATMAQRGVQATAETEAGEQSGYFQRAAGGSLFIKDIDTTPKALQPLLLRALETGHCMSKDGTVAQNFQTRVIAGTTEDLATLVRNDRFHGPLRQRFAGLVIHVPALAARMEDLGLLFKHFLEQEVCRVGCQHRLRQQDPQADPWLPAPLAAALFEYDWPGNLRQLQQCARQLVMAGQYLDQIPMAEWDQFQADASAWDADVRIQPLDTEDGRPLETISTDTLHTAMTAERYELSAVAARLNISQHVLYALIRRTAGLHLIGDLEPATIIDAFQQTNGDMDAMVTALQVSKSALAQRVHELGLSTSAADGKSEQA